MKSQPIQVEKLNYRKLSALILIGCVILSAFFIVFSSMQAFNGKGEFIPKSDTLPDNGWTASEDRFAQGVAGPKPKGLSEESQPSQPDASYFGHQTMPSTIRLLVILVKFSDLANTLTKTQMQDKIFGSANSLADYWSEVTYGGTAITGAVTDWLTLANTQEYYGRDTAGDPGSDNYYGYKSKYLTDSINLADPSVNYANYDKIMIIHAGNDQASSGQDYDMWSSAYLPYYGPYWYRDGTYINTASCLAETDLFGVCAHEFGHQCNLPDLYDYDKVNNFVSDWCLMDHGNWNGNPAASSPAYLTGWCRYFLGIIPDTKIRTVVDTQCLVFTLDDLETGGSNYLVAKIPLERSTHYYMIEARFLVGYDSALPGQGIIITEVDETIDGGYGIVKAIDSRPGTATKNDGEFDYESAETEYGIWHDTANNIHVIIVSRTADTYTLMVDRKSIDRVNTWTLSRRTIAAQTIATFDLGYAIAGQRVAWEWKDVAGGSDNIDSWLQLEGGGTYETVEDYSHDSGAVVIPITGIYTFKIRNENLLLSTTYDFAIVAYNAYDVRIISAEYAPATIYEYSNFTVTATIQNWGNNALTAPKMRAYCWDGIGYQSIESGEKVSPNLGEMETYTATFYLRTLAPRLDAHVSINPSYSMYDYYPYSKEVKFDILDDSSQPMLTIVSPQQSEITPDSDIVLEWEGSDGESGLKQFKVFANTTLKSTLGALADQYILENLADGWWNLTVQAIDNAGNLKNASITILIDGTSPVSDDFSTGIVWVRDGVTCEFSVSAHDGLSGMDISTLYIESSPDTWVAVDIDLFIGSSAPLSYTFGVLTSDTVRLKAISADRAGNTVESDPILLQVDNTAPSLSIESIVSEALDSSKINGVMNISIASGDIGSGIESISINLTYRLAFGSKNITAIAILNPSSGRYEFSFNTTGVIADKDVNITVAAYDVAGNMKIIRQQVYVSNVPPGNTGLDPMIPMVILISIGACAGAAMGGVVVVKRVKIAKVKKRELADSIDFSDEDSWGDPAPKKTSEFGFDELFMDSKQSDSKPSPENSTRLDSPSKDETVFEF